MGAPFLRDDPQPERREFRYHFQLFTRQNFGEDYRRWTSQDPLGYAAGDSNLYRYVRNGPANATDPTGLDIFGSPFGFVGSPKPSTLPSLSGPANLELKVITPAQIENNRFLMEVAWRPQNVKEGGWIIQHAHVEIYYTYKNNWLERGASFAGSAMRSFLNRGHPFYATSRTTGRYSQTVDIWEAWYVEAKSIYNPSGPSVYGGGPNTLPVGKNKAHDTFMGTLSFPADSCGTLKIIGYAKYVDDKTADITWPVGGTKSSPTLPSTYDKPASWSDEQALKHGFIITWTSSETSNNRYKISKIWPEE